MSNLWLAAFWSYVTTIDRFQLSTRRVTYYLSFIFCLIYILSFDPVNCNDTRNMTEEPKDPWKPSQWSSRLGPDEIVEKHVEVAKKVSESNKKEIPYESNVHYGDNITDLIDIFGKTSIPDDSPIFVYIHGGFWHMLEKNLSAYCVKPLWQAGIRVGIPEYELAPKASIGMIVNQIRTMAKFMLEMATEKKSRTVWFGGHSAGGHLAASLLDENWLKQLNATARQNFKGVVLISGIYDLVPILKTEVNDDLKMSHADAIEFSPILKSTDFVKKSLLGSDFKALVVVGDEESPAFKEQSKNYLKILQDDNLNAKFLEVPHSDHFNLVENLQHKTYGLTQRIISLVTKSEF